MDAKMNAKVMNSRRNMQKLINRCLKLRSIEIGDDMLFVDILKTLQFLDKTLKTNFHEVIEYALDFSSGINFVIERSSDELIVKYYPDLIESFLIMLTTTWIHDKLIDFLYIIQDMGLYVPEETKRFTFIELEHWFKRLIDLIRDEANYQTQVMGMQIFVIFVSLFNDSERVKIVNNLFSEEFENSRYYLWYLKRENFDLNCRLFLNAMNEDNLTYNKRCNVYSLKATSIKLGDINLIPPMEGDEQKLDLWVDYNFSNGTITFFCDGKSFKKADCVWPLFKINKDSIQDHSYFYYSGHNELKIYLKYPIFTDDASVSHLVQIYKTVCFEFEQTSNFVFFCKKVWPAFLKRVWKSSPRTRISSPQKVSCETITPQEIVFETMIDSAVQEETNEAKENEFKVPSVEDIPKASLKRRYLTKLDLNTAEPKAKKVNVVEPLAGPSYVHRINNLKYPTNSKLSKLTINLTKSVKPTIKQTAKIDVYDFNLDQELSTSTPIRRTRSTGKSFIPHSDFLSPVKISANEKASFSYRTDAKKSSPPTISQSDKLFEEMLQASLKEAQQISNDEMMLEAGTSGGDDLGITEEEKIVKLKTPKISLKNKRFKKYSPLNELTKQ